MPAMINQYFRIESAMARSLTGPADFCLSYDDDSVFIDFNHYGNEQVRLIRISFDGYGCCTPAGTTIPLDINKSRLFKEQVAAGLTDQDLVLSLVKESIALNTELLWVDALEEYALI